MVTCVMSRTYRSCGDPTLQRLGDQRNALRQGCWPSRTRLGDGLSHWIVKDFAPPSFPYAVSTPVTEVHP